MYINISKVDFGRCYSGSGGGGEVNLDYMTLSALGDGEITISIPAELSSTQATSFSYSKDKSKWTDTIVDNTAKTISIPIKSGDNVYLKGDALTLFNEELFGGLSINSTANIDASGNIMSLLYGDNFTDKTTLPEGGTYNFGSLFSGNEHLINAKDLKLPATTLNYSCYSSMFEGCTSLATSPALPATTLAENCYEFIFSGCTSLTTAPELPATTLAPGCYGYMFSDCTSLSTSPELPATTLADNCYNGMFSGCTSLTNATLLQATTLASSCYSSMFSGCTAITTSPTLPVTALADSCYSAMFLGCTSLTTAPVLPAVTLANSCYERMFYRCSKLNNITMLATDISATNCLTNWVGGVASTGTFTKAKSMTSLPTGESGIPTGWTVVDATDYMTLSALGDGEITITIPAAINSSYATSLSYSKDKSTWNETIIDDTDQTINIPVTSGENVYLKGVAKELGKYNSYININSTANINASGNIMSLLYGDDYNGKTSFPEGSEHTFRSLFSGNTHLISAGELILPATTVSTCYYSMFDGCTSLTTAPELPATTLVNGCYRYMFQGCTSLTTAPELPATELADYCYDSMFKGCTTLTTAPELPATTLTYGCYEFMFDGCTSLTTAPELPATTLTFSCYSNMFYGCSKLNSITMLATDISASGCLLTWVYGLAPTGTFTKAKSMTTLPSGASGIPEGWTVKDYGVVDYSQEYMTLSALGDGEITITIPAGIDSTCATSLSYSKDKATWNETVIDNTLQTISINVTSGDNVYLKGIAKNFGTGVTKFTTINSTADINASGNIMSLLYGDDYKDKVAFQTGTSSTFSKLFRNNTHLINTENLILPATELKDNCYQYMFNGCTSLKTAPELPATKLRMMSYYYMFSGCSSLTTAPELHATTLAYGCYGNMFSGCTSLNNITMLATDISAQNCLSNWVNGVAETGTFTKAASMTSLPTDVNGIPEGWTVVDYVAA